MQSFKCCHQIFENALKNPGPVDESPGLQQTLFTSKDIFVDIHKYQHLIPSVQI